METAMPLILGICIIIIWRLQVTNLILDFLIILFNIFVHFFFEKFAFRITSNYAISIKFINKKFINKHLSPQASRFELEKTDLTGYTSEIFRLKVYYDSALPKSYIIKSTSPQYRRKHILRIGRMFHEEKFYSHYEQLVNGIFNTPKCFYASSFIGTDTLLVL